MFKVSKKSNGSRILKKHNNDDKEKCVFTSILILAGSQVRFSHDHAFYPDTCQTPAAKLPSKKPQKVFFPQVAAVWARLAQVCDSENTRRARRGELVLYVHGITGWKKPMGRLTDAVKKSWLNKMHFGPPYAQCPKFRCSFNLKGCS